MANEFSESFKATESCQNNICSLGDYAMVRQNTQLGQTDRQSNNKLEDAGVLPKLAFNLADGSGSDDVIELKYPVGKNIATKEMKDAGVSARESVDDEGRKTTSSEIKSGVKVSITEGKDTTTPSGNKVHIDDTVMIEPNGKIHETAKGSGHWVDDKGKEMVRQNKDGSVIIDTGDGGFYKQDSHGMKKISAIRSRDGKTFDVLDTDNPVSEDMRKDMDQVRQARH